jgi:hypothetical protein
MRTRHPRSLTSPASHSELVRSVITSLRLLVPLGMRISERRALLKRDGRSAQHRCQLRGAHACFPYHTLSSSSWRFDTLRVHRANNHGICIPAAPLRSSHRHLALHAHVHDETRRARPGRPCAGVSESERRRTAITWSAVDDGHVRLVSWWRSPVAGVRSLSRAICAALSPDAVGSLGSSGCSPAAVGVSSWT